MDNRISAELIVHLGRIPEGCQRHASYASRARTQQTHAAPNLLWRTTLGSYQGIFLFEHTRNPELAKLLRPMSI